MLGLGVAGAWAALEAISAAYHGWPIFLANGASQGAGWVVREVYVGIVTSKQIKSHGAPMGLNSYSTYLKYIRTR